LGGEDFRKIAWVKWDSFCLPQEDEWFRVRRIVKFNLSLLGKWCWRMFVDKDELWYRVLKARYGEERGRMKEGGRHDSLWWRTMCNIRGGTVMGVGCWFENITRREVGDDRNTCFWTDNLVGGVPLGIKFRRLFDLAVHRDWVWRIRLLAWEEDSVQECTLLLHNIVLQENIQDIWKWLLDPVQGYSVRGT